MSTLMRGWSNREVIEDTVNITIQDLKTWGYLSPGYKSGILTLSRNGQKTGGLGFSVRIENEYDSYIEFDYLLNGKPVKYTHRIEFFPCHYGNIRYYFICRETGKRVTALYLVGGYFASRHFHRMSYQCSRDHRSGFDLVHKWQNLERRAEWLKKNGHPRKAEKCYWKARYYEDKSWEVAAQRWGIPFEGGQYRGFYKALSV